MRFKEKFLKEVDVGGNDELSNLMKKDVEKNFLNEFEYNEIRLLENLVKYSENDEKLFKAVKSKIEKYYSEKSNENNQFAILGELYVMSLLYEVFGSKIHFIQEQQTKTPDIEIEGENTYFEIYTPTFNEIELNKIKSFKSKNQKIITTTPFGYKNNEIISLSAINRIVSAKNDYKQFSKDNYNILVLNFFSKPMWCVDKMQCFPLSIYNGKFYSGNIWQALYGKKGDMIIQELDIDEQERVINDFKDEYMVQDGKFVQKVSSILSGILVILKDGIVFFENINTNIIIKDEIIKKIMQLEDFDYNCSFMRFKYNKFFNYNFFKSIEKERNTINNLISRMGKNE